jgi:hypothetical protein
MGIVYDAVRTFYLLWTWVKVCSRYVTPTISYDALRLRLQLPGNALCQQKKLDNHDIGRVPVN